MKNIQAHFDLLGHEVEDKVTRQKGVVTSVSFDLFGCIQVVIDPGLDREKKRLECLWYDVSRIKIIGKKPVMEQPNYDHGPISEGKKGPADKPIP